MAGKGGAQAKSISPVGLAFLGVGTFIEGQAKYNALLDQSYAEKANASFFRDQADFAQFAGDRQKVIYNEESQVLYGEQMSGFAKAGIDTENSSFFMATQMLQRNRGANAITLETDMNVRLANARADASQSVAAQYETAATNEQRNTFFKGAATMGLGFL